MKALQISDGLNPDSSEGRRVLTVSRVLADEGHEVTVASAARSPEEKRRVESLASPDVKLLWHMPLFRFSNFSYSPGLFDMLSRGGYDLVHAHSYRHYGTYVGSILKKKTGTPYVLSPYGSISYESSGSLSFLYWMQDIVTRKYPIRLADRILANTLYERSQIIDFGGEPEKIDVVYREVDTELFRKVDLGDNGARAVLFVGRITPIKGIELIIDALARLNADIQLSLVGPCEDNAYLSKLKGRAKSLGVDDRVVFHGQVPYEELPLHYSSALVLVLPSRYENLGGVLLEAQSCQCPVIASDVGGMGEVIDDGSSGYILRERSPVELAERIGELAADDSLRRKMGRKGRIFVSSTFSTEGYIRKIVGAYEKALK
ncbi:glycosyltransferase family 4 protein [Candidatus Bathyarchaeota archaeon]|nr:glycosyltransferase family 4 protein [Candidatus Bathyarchaeota archaeon]